MSKLFKLRISIEVVVLAEDEEHAREVAENEYHEIVGDAHGPMIKYGDAERISHVAQIPDTWSKDAFPYGGERNTDEERLGGILHREQLAPLLED